MSSGEEDETPVSKLGLGEVETISSMSFIGHFTLTGMLHKDHSRTPGRTRLEVASILKDKIRPKGVQADRAECPRGRVDRSRTPPITDFIGSLSLNPSVPYQRGSPKDQHENSLPVQQGQEDDGSDRCLTRRSTIRGTSRRAIWFGSLSWTPRAI